MKSANLGDFCEGLLVSWVWGCFDGRVTIGVFAKINKV